MQSTARGISYTGDMDVRKLGGSQVMSVYDLRYCKLASKWGGSRALFPTWFYSIRIARCRTCWAVVTGDCTARSFSSTEYVREGCGIGKLVVMTHATRIVLGQREGRGQGEEGKNNRELHLG